MITPQKCAKVLFICYKFLLGPKRDTTAFPTNESDWSRKVNKVRKILVKPGALP